MGKYVNLALFIGAAICGIVILLNFQAILSWMPWSTENQLKRAQTENALFEQKIIGLENSSEYQSKLRILNDELTGKQTVVIQQIGRSETAIRTAPNTVASDAAFLAGVCQFSVTPAAGCGNVQEKAQ